WIYDPVNDLMVHATRGEGAWCDGDRLAVAAEVPPEQITGSAYGRARSGVRAAKALSASGRIGAVHNRGCSGLEYIALVEGRSHFSLHSRSLPWDHAAGMLIVREAAARRRSSTARPMTRAFRTGPCSPRQARRRGGS